MKNEQQERINFDVEDAEWMGKERTMKGERKNNEGGKKEKRKRED